MNDHRNPRASVPKRPTPDNLAPRVDARDFEYHMNGLRLSVGRADALADALRRYFDERDHDEVAERRVSHLVDLTAETAERAVDELERACDAMASRRSTPTVPSGQIWQDG
jgi:hypothetical protein